VGLRVLHQFPDRLGVVSHNLAQAGVLAVHPRPFAEPLEGLEGLA
jgi:hypothetical protein